MPETMIVRLRPHDKRKGQVRRTYTYQSKTYHAGCWYKVDAGTAKYLATVLATDAETSPLSFDVCDKREDAGEIEERERQERLRLASPDETGTLSIKDLSSEVAAHDTEYNAVEEATDEATPVQIPGAPAKRRTPKRTSRRARK